MKLMSHLKYAVLTVLLALSCSSFSPLYFNIDTVSPRKTYRVKLEGREESFSSSVQQVKLTVIKGTETVFADDKFYREEVDHPFLREYPAQEWISDSILRFAKVNNSQRSPDKIVVVNNGKERVDVLKVEYASREKFLIFDLSPGAKLELTVLPYSTNGQSPNPNVSYSAFANGQTFQNMVSEWRKTGAGSEILIELGTSSADQKSTGVPPLTQINLAAIGRIAPKGRVQDADYNQLPVVEQLIAHGKQSIPYLISKLDDETKIQGRVIDYWNEVRVADVAFIILTDFFTDHTWQNTTIPGIGWNEFLEGGGNKDIPAQDVLRNYISKHGRTKIKSRWQSIWDKYRDKVEWDQSERCFKPTSVVAEQVKHSIP
jgi:hypothetical protein